jgi:phycocyanobilin lyase beta subunit
LHDPNSSVQECAALALFAHPTPQAIPDLIALIGGENALLSRLSADSLVQIGSLAVPALLEALENGLQPVRLEAVRALALIADRSTIPALFASLEDDSALIAYWAEEGLERMGVGMRFFIP